MAVIEVVASTVSVGKLELGSNGVGIVMKALGGCMNDVGWWSKHSEG